MTGGRRESLLIKVTEGLGGGTLINIIVIGEEQTARTP